jgi:nitrogen regulatory protein P-II 2
MDLKELTLVTIITERLLRDDIIDIIKGMGVTGYTLSDTTGEGSRGIRASDWEGKNVKIEVIVTEERADKIIEKISDDYFENYAVVAYTQQVKVVRGQKYIGE